MKLTVSEIVALCGGRLRVGDPEFSVSGFAALDEAGPTDLSFLGNEKYLPAYRGTAAGVVLVVEQAPVPREGIVLIDVANPSLAFSQVMEGASAKRPFAAEIHPTAFVHPTAEVAGVMVRAHAVIEEGVRIGVGSEIGPGTVVEREVEIGSDCLLHGNVVIRERCQLGNRVVVQPGAVIGSEGYGYETVDGRHRAIPQVGIVVLEDEVEVGANTTIDRARFGKTLIGEGTKIDNLVQIGHNVTIGKHCLIVAQTGIAGSCRIGNNVTIAAQCGIAGHLEVTDGVVLATRSGVPGSVTKPGVYWGTPPIPLREEKKLVVLRSQLPSFKKELKQLRKEVDELKN
ncbi:UDP-3-O-(3-hydroxymyristoyl)glucosamine N-acyltransferase [Roseibacillus ishigakijimensis]|uniref:UDP-3-O-acylglucosamine N-acyltransferase n=1 Tax=Roseibacillus ishigakijimensis TaxID=454146 RepID=A0A934RLM8_9BACT|nr:UDP-3-O-(3-hydroxymyristoyl)glucosamine N-acyltransferase [Roseibacillus ishigakijimensis]MBK1833108.1 UDP-3-O-(3-hydroxymyristoyl)glucosamine N-acyltransferase [Roseibacillus ishigakijimensis]